MNRPQAKAEWDEAFKGTISFDAALRGEIYLSEEQADVLLKSRVKQCERELAEIYKPYWEKFKPNEQHALIDIYYVSGPKYVGKGTKIYENEIKYSQTGDCQFLEAILEEIYKLPE